jgi:hypothetical protein
MAFENKASVSAVQKSLSGSRTCPWGYLLYCKKFEIRTCPADRYACQNRVE